MDTLSSSLDVRCSCFAVSVLIHAEIAKSLGKALVKVEESWNVHLGATTNIMDSLAGEIDQINRDKNAVRNETFETYKTLESLRPPATLPTW